MVVCAVRPIPNRATGAPPDQKRADSAHAHRRVRKSLGSLLRMHHYIFPWSNTPRRGLVRLVVVAARPLPPLFLLS